MELKYITNFKEKLNSNQNVYFTCHPDDFDTYFETITGSVLGNRGDITIWYREDMCNGFQSNEEMDELLSQMQLFVFPVTNRLLTDKSIAMDIEYVYAVKKQIPVLPIVEESGIDKPFRRKFHNRHYISPKSEEPSLKSYEEQLEDHLTRVLFRDEMRERICNAFDAYIFMSYRKKDRKYALELMQQIHNISRYRDFGIWYDEYLIPGEDYNRNIKQMIKICDLFTLVVTPNLINERNYVLKKEYPLARRLKKPIVLVEKVETDKKALKKKCKRMPDAVKGAGRGLVLRPAFMKKYREMEIKKSVDSPEHMYLIGCAYLNGIDVEINSARAVELITKAAEMGFPEAVGKLADMYLEGQGVEQDYDMFIQWSEKKLEYVRKGANTKFYLNVLFEYGTKLQSIHKYDKAKVVLSEFDVMCDEYTRETKSREFNEASAIVNDFLSDLAMKENNYMTAKAHCEKALAIRKKLTEDEGLEENRVVLGINYMALGNICRDLGEVDKASEYYRIAEELTGLPM